MTPPSPLLLMTPGPTRVPDRVLAAGAQPVMHHRTLEFSALQGAFYRSTPQAVAMEAAICSLFSPGDEVIACCGLRAAVFEPIPRAKTPSSTPEHAPRAGVRESG